jgi:hypothetical protein
LNRSRHANQPHERLHGFAAFPEKHTTLVFISNRDTTDRDEAKGEETQRLARLARR